MTIPNTPVGTDTDMFGEIANWAWEIQGRINRKETKIRYFKIKQRFICLKLFNFQLGYLNFFSLRGLLILMYLNCSLTSLK